MSEQKTLGQRIKRERLAAGLTLDALAEQLGTRRQTLINWERDTFRPGPRYAQLLSEVLPISYDELRPIEVAEVRDLHRARLEEIRRRRWEAVA